MIRTVALALVAVSVSGCSVYSRYAAAIHRDVDAPSRAIALALARLQLTVVHGSVPPDSVPVWATELENAAKLAAKGSADFATLAPPDRSLAADHYRLAQTIAHQSATVATAAAEAETCLSSQGDGCEQLTSARYYKVLEPLTEQQDLVRWSRERIARDLQPHGVLLSGMIQ
jgi:hypothetical protein